MTPIEKLDLVLLFMANEFPLYQRYTDADIFSALVSKSSVLYEQGDFGSEVISILGKLQKDGFVNIYYGKENPEGYHENLYLDRYQITFEGVYFIKHQDGYRGRDLRKNAENIRLETLEKNQMVNQNAMTVLTAILTVVGLITAVFCLVELYWKYHWFH